MSPIMIAEVKMEKSIISATLNSALFLSVDTSIVFIRAYPVVSHKLQDSRRSLSFNMPISSI